MKPTLLVLAAGMGSRYGGLKQIDAFGKNGEAIIEFSIYDAIRAGFWKVVFVIREEFEQAFKEKFENTFQDKIQVEYVYQDKKITIDGKEYGTNREKPWGTGHAMLVAKEKIQEPFAVINADDYYGVSAYQQIADYFTTTLDEKKCCIIGYILKNTLSESGHVNRWICKTTTENTLVSVKECLKISKKSDGKITDEENLEISENAVVSMNFWGFHPEIFTQLEEEFKKFVLENHEQEKTEFYIPSFVDTLIKKWDFSCDVLESHDAWCGVTYPEDKPEVTKKILNFIDEGKYPNNLWK